MSRGSRDRWLFLALAGLRAPVKPRTDAAMCTCLSFGLLIAVVLVLAVLASGGGPAYAWTAPVALNTNAETDAGTDSYPEVTTDGGGNWLAVWQSTDNLGGAIGTDRDILVSRSTDNGATWTAPTALNTSAASDLANDDAPQVTTDGGGNWVAAWESQDNLEGTIGFDYDILVSRSTDNGATWTAQAALNSNAATDSLHDHCPQVTTDGGGNWLAVWESEDDLGGTIGTDWDILMARSADNGATWTAPAALNTNAATDSGSDDIPQVTTDGAGNWLAVWESEENLGGIGTDWDILVARSADNGATWTAPAVLNTNAASDSGSDDIPQVTTDDAGNWVTVWHSRDDLGGTIGDDWDILVARSTDNGASWTDPAALNTNAATDSDADADRYPQVTTDGGGNWVAVWRSTVNLGGTIGDDYDILCATCSPLDADCPGADDDGDGVADLVDNCPTKHNPDQTDTDSDGEGNECDADDDNDTVPDAEDAAPLNAFVCRDVDADTCDDCSVLGQPDVSDDGSDNDSDGLCDAGDPDDDNDLMLDTYEQAHACLAPLLADGMENADGDELRNYPEMIVGTDPCLANPELAADGDADGFSDGRELYIGTDPTLGCGTDAWSVDINNDASCDTLDVGKFRPVIFSQLGDANYNRRFDLNADTKIDTLDVGKYRSYIFTSCTT